MRPLPVRALHGTSLALLLISALVIAVGYSAIPDPTAVHYAGVQPSTMQDKSLWSAFFLPVFGLLVVIALALLTPDPWDQTRPQPVGEHAGSAGVAVPYSPAMAERQRHQLDTRRRGLAWLGLGFSFGIAYAGPVAVLPALAPASRWSLPVIVVATFLGLLKMLNLTIGTGRRVHLEIDPDAEEIQRAEALAGQKKLYRPGSFYYNKLDPMPIVKARRQPEAMDYNYAHPPGQRFLWTLLAVLLVVAAVVVIPTFTTM